MFQRIQYGWRLSMQALTILRQYPSLLVPIIFARACYVLAFVAILHPVMRSMEQHDQHFLINLFKSIGLQYHLGWLFLLLLCVAYLLNIIMTFCHTVSSLRVYYLAKGESRSSWQVCRQLLPHGPRLIWWCLVRSMLGHSTYFLRAYWREKGYFKKYLVNGNFHTSTLLVYYFLFIENMPAFKAWRASVTAVRERWGEALIIHFNIGYSLIIIALELILYGPIIYWLFVTNNGADFTLGLILLYAAHNLIKILQSGNFSMIRGALFAYQATNTVEKPFSVEALREVFRPDVPTDDI